MTFLDGTTRTADWWQDSIHPETARVLATYASGDLEGRPAILDNAVGRGRVVYVGTRLEPGALRDTLLEAVTAAGVTPLVAAAPGHLEAARRVGDGAEFLFLLNHSETEPAEVGLAAD
ncbi:beta-galactosidase trimerization domain-containing protein, partial [Streptomyces sp. MCAF7]